LKQFKRETNHLAEPFNPFSTARTLTPSDTICRNYCGGAVVAGAVDEGGGVVAAPPGVTAPGLFCVELPFLWIPVFPVGEFVSLAGSVPLLPFDEPLPVALSFVLSRAVPFSLLPVVGLVAFGFAVVGAVGSAGLVALPGVVCGLAVPFTGSLADPGVAEPEPVDPGVVDPGAAVAAPLPAEPGAVAGELCAIIAPVNIVPAANVTSRSAFIDLLVIRLPHRGNVFPAYCDDAST
jgi:hypothetical protein